MRVRFWGTRGSIATPGPSTNHFGGNTSCVQVVTEHGQLFILDIGTGGRELGAELLASGTAPIHGTILLTHVHWDHIQGFPFFAPLFVHGNEFAVYSPSGGGRSLEQTLAGQMQFTYFPVELSQLPASITYHDLGEGPHEIDGVRILAQFLNHPAATLGYRFEVDGAAVVCLTDHEPFSDTLWRGDAEPGRIESILHEGDRRHARLMTNADLVIHDAQYTPEEYPSKKSWGHSHFEYVVELAAAAGAKQLALTHHDPTHDDRLVAEIEQRAREVAARRGSPLKVFCAFEGYELNVQAVKNPTTGFVLPKAAGPRTSAARVLVIDDDEDVRVLVRRALEGDGHIVTEATNGVDGLQAVFEAPPDLLILDMLLPQMTGLDLLKAIRTRAATLSIPVLILTSLDDESSTRAGFELGATDYLTKPFSMPQLAARVRSCLARVTNS